MNKSNKTKIFCFLAISLLGFLSSCEWDSSLYTEFVTNDTISPCPPKVYYHIVDGTAYLVTRNPEAELYSDNTWVYSDDNGNYISESQRIRAVESTSQYYTAKGRKLVKWEIAEKYYNQGTVLPKLKYILIRTTTENNTEQEIQCILNDSDSTDIHPECKQFSKSFQYNLCPVEYNSCEFDDDQKVFFCAKKNSGPKCNQASDCESLMKGWEKGKGSCDEGVCVPFDCATGYHLVENIGICEPDDSSNCGKLGNACQRGQVCSKGKCVSNCGQDEVFCQYDNAGVQVSVCANPQSDSKFCGADNDCKGYQSCTDGKTCIKGKCEQTSCPNRDEELCVVNGIKVCINIHGNDASHCGFCNYACKDHPVYNASSSGPATSDICDNGECVYECASDDENCSYDAKNPTCISREQLKSDSSHCGTCTNVCPYNTYCNNSQCVISRCSRSNECLNALSGECVNTPEQCGTSCTNCKTANHAEDGICKEGVCEITACVPGYHLTSAEAEPPLTCIKNEVNNCGSDEKNCPDYVEGWQDGYCTEMGECTVTSCVIGYHLITENGKEKCEKDAETACGILQTNCKDIPGWNTGSCQNGLCAVQTCQNNYCLNDKNTCVDGTANNNACGIRGNACKVCPANHACLNGACSRISCGSDNTCFFHGECVNTPDRCGKDCINCNTAGNAASGTCNNGTCTINKCAVGYHKNGNFCSVDSVTECGTPQNNCKNIAGWSDGYCANQKCVATACKNTHHISNGTCVENTVTNCGPSGINCNSTGVAKAACTNGACKVESCTANYHLAGNTCAANTKEICGASKTDCTKQAGWKDGSCANGSCKASACDAGYHINGNNCVADSPKECGASRTNCTTTLSGWKSGYCVNGSCVLTGCNTNYCMSGGKCVDGRSAANTCGSDGGTCKKCDSNQKCSSGACVPKQ